MSENVLRSAVDGQVLLKIMEQGELVSPGQPVITDRGPLDQWITLNLRKTGSRACGSGDTLLATIPAVDSAVAAVRGLLHLAAGRLRYLAGDAGGGRLRRAHVRGARPAASRPLPALRPGMSALVDWPPRAPSMSGLAAVARRELRRLRAPPVLWALLGPHPGGNDPAAHRCIRDGGGSRPARGRPRSRPERHLAHRHPLARGDPQRSTGRSRRGSGSRAVGRAREREVYGVLVVRVTSSATSSGVVRPTLTFLYNEEYLTAGGNVSGDVSRGASTAAALLTALSGREPAPIRVDLRSLFNPAASYAQALGILLISGLLRVVIGYVDDLRRRARARRRDGFRVARGGGAARRSRHGVESWDRTPYAHCLLVMAPPRCAMRPGTAFRCEGRSGCWSVATIAFVLASQAFAILIIGVDGKSEDRAWGWVRVIFGPAAAFAGVTFPLGAMPVGARIWAETSRSRTPSALTRAGIIVGAPETAGGPLLALALTTAIALGLALPRAAGAAAQTRSTGGGHEGARPRCMAHAPHHPSRAGNAPVCSWPPRCSTACSTRRRTSIRCCATNRCSWWTATIPR